MKISLQWLQDYVDVSDYMKKPEELAELLTRAGLEVEEIHNKRKDYDQVVVGLILEKDKHPNADKLSLCKVTTGEGVVHQIVCGAQNHKANDRVVVALPGAILPGGFAIKTAAVRGVESGGMLCSLKELGLPGDSDGILILPEDAPIGKPFAEYKGLDDVVFVLKVTANRADCLSHYGLAREISCLLSRPLKEVVRDFAGSGLSSKEIGLEVKTAELCPRYTGRFMKNVKVGPSPAWLTKRLESVGLKPINNVVDITNFVMMDLGQPLHAFDADKLSGRKIVVDKARPGEKFKTLDGTELTLKGDELLIKDGEKAVCIAGVIGGLNSGVTEETKNVFLESAYFAPASVRKTARGNGIETDSAYRFARGVDPEGALRALDRATGLIAKAAGGEGFEAAGDAHDFYPAPVRKLPVQLSVAMVSQRLGYEASETKLLDFMKRLGCIIEPASGGSGHPPGSGAPGVLSVLPPSFRFDLEQDMDLVEEYARLNGYEHIPESLPAIAEAPAAHDGNFLVQRKISRVLQREGFHQAFNYAFTSSAGEKEFLGGLRGFGAAGLVTEDKPITLRNPLNAELDIMRTTLSLGLYKNLVTNYGYGNHVGRLFEIGSIFVRGNDGGYAENTRLGVIAWGHPTGLWNKEAAPPVFEVKAAIEALLRSLGMNAITWTQPTDKGDVPGFLHRGQTAHLQVEGQKVGLVGTFHPLRLDEHKIRVPAAYAELDLDRLLKGPPRALRVEGLARTPIVERDFAFVMPRTMKVADVGRAMKQAAGASLVHVDVFDVYEGDKMEAGKKSVAFRLHYQDKNGTLQDAQIQDLQSKVLAAAEKLGLSIR